MIHYKVVNSFMRSYFASMDAEVQYEIGRWSQAPEKYAKHGFHLFVFDTLEDATEFIYGGAWVVPMRSRWTNIWKCECEDEVRVPERIPEMAEADMLQCSGSILFVPDGTMMFKRVKLIERVLR